MRVNQVYIIASTWQGIELDQKVFFTAHKANKHLSILLEDADVDKPDPDDDPVEVVSNYYEWVREENDNMCQVDIAVTVLDYTGHVDERQSDET